MAIVRSLLPFYIYLVLAFPVLGQLIQKPCSKCYVVMNNGDTIRCSVENQEDYAQMKKIRIQIKDSEETLKVKVKDIQALNVPGKYYEKVEFEKGYHLMLRVVNGYVKMYQDYSFEWKGYNETDPDILVENEVENPDPEKIPLFYVMIEGQIYRLGQDNFRQELANHFKDYLELSDQLLLDEILYSDVRKVVKEYNQWKAKQIKEPIKDK
jgi:hypothetical protein